MVERSRCLAVAGGLVPIDIVKALVGWPVHAVGDNGIRLVRGSPDERVLRYALERGAVTVGSGLSGRSRITRRVALMARAVFSSPPRLLPSASGSVGDSFRTAIVAQSVGVCIVYTARVQFEPV